MTSDQPWWLTMPPAEVAATILAYFSHQTHVSPARAMHGIVSWWRTGSYPRSLAIPGEWELWENPDYRAVAEAIQVLEHANLLMYAEGRGQSHYVGLTRLGWHALQTNTVRQHLGLGDTPPTG